jgi:nitrate/nitrite-specific signal transduction histidine kinase
MSITDDGIGLPEEFDQNDGKGMRIMRNRAQMIGGLLDIERNPSGGLMVTCLFPINPAAGAL